MTRVFISHSSKDREVIEREIISPLRAQGLDTWYSTDSIQSASEWERQIREGLRACDWFLVVLSPQAIASEWVQREVHWAFLKRKDKIIPVMLESCDPEELHLGLLPIQFIDFRDDFAQAQDKLLALWGLNKATRVSTLYQDAQAVLAQEDWTKAIEQLEALLRLDPSHTQAQADLKHARQQQQSAVLYETAVTQLRENRWRNALKTLHALDSDYKDVSDLIASANAELEKEDAERLYGQASDAIEREDWATAVNHLQTALKLNPTHAEAEAMLSRALQQRELNEQYAAGLAHLQAGRWREALKSLRRVRAIDKSYKGVADLIAEADAGLEEEEERPQRERREREAKEEAERQAKEAREKLYQDALDAISREDWEAATEKLRAAREGDPDNAEIAAKSAEVDRRQQLAKIFESGIEHCQNKRWAEALSDFRRVQETDKDYKNLSTHITQAETGLKVLRLKQERERQDEAAKEQVKEQVKEQAKEQAARQETTQPQPQPLSTDNKPATDIPAADSQTADTLAALFDEAAPRQNKLFFISMGAAIALVILTYLLWPNSRPTVDETYSPGAIPSPSPTPASVNTNSNTNTSTNANTSAVQSSSSDYYDKGLVLYEERKYADADSQFRQAIALKPDDAVYHNALGRSLYDQGRIEPAEEAFRAAIKWDRRVHEYWFNLGLALKAQNRHLDAGDAFREASRLDRNNAVYHKDFGDALYEQGRYEEAESEFAKAVNLDSRNSNYYNKLGNAVYMQNKYEEAEGYYRKALKVDANNKSARDNLNMVLKRLSEN